MMKNKLLSRQTHTRGPSETKMLSALFVLLAFMIVAGQSEAQMSQVVSAATPETRVEAAAVSFGKTNMLEAVADAFVRDGGYSSSNFGARTLLEVKSGNAGLNREAYLKFNLGNVSNIAGARLRIYATVNKNKTSLMATGHGVANTNWSEAAITWNTRPPMGPDITNSTITGSMYAFYELDVSLYIISQKAAGNNLVSLGLRNANRNRTSEIIQFYSREASANHPTLVVYSSNSPPSVSLSAPTNNSVFIGPAQVPISVQAFDSDGSVTQVIVYAGSTAIKTFSTQPYSFVWTNRSSGTHFLSAAAFDNSGLVATSSIVRISIVDSPSISITAPNNMASFVVGETINIQASASSPNGSIPMVEFFDGTNKIGEALVAPFMLGWTNAGPGTHSLTARVTDAAGASSNSQPVSITVVDSDSDYDGRSNLQELSDGTDPFNPSSVRKVLLGSWGFDSSAFRGDQGQVPTYSNGVRLVSSWRSNAVEMPFNAICTGLIYHDVEPGGQANINCRNGTLRFWFKPNWNSTSRRAQGGPRTDARLIELGGYTYSGGHWFLGLNPDGDHLVFYSASNSVPNEVNITPIQWLSNHWYQIVLTYSPSNSAVYLNGQLAATGRGVAGFPDPQTRAQGFRIGFDLYCTQSPNGQFEAMETFNYPLDAMTIAHEFPNYQNAAEVVDSDYDGRSDFLETQVDKTSAFDNRDVAPMRMAYFRFNDLGWTGEEGQQPLATNGIRAVAGWSGTALEVPAQAVGSGLVYRVVETNGWANIQLHNGSVRFWFKPNWNSASPAQTAGGPQTSASLVELGAQDSSDGWWVLGIGPQGTNLFFASMTDLNFTYYFSPSIQWVSGQWHLLHLLYSPTNSALYLDGSLLASGIGVQSYPNTQGRSTGLRIGGGRNGGQSPNGQFDEFETFNYPLNPNSFPAEFGLLNGIDTDLDGIPDLLEELPAVVSTPFNGNPFVTAGVIEAEQFDLGGNGIAYLSQADHATTGYRRTRLAIEPSTDMGGGYCLSKLKAGDWVKYAFETRHSHNYDLAVRCFAATAGARFALEIGRANGTSNFQTASLQIPAGSWQSLVFPDIPLAAGTNFVKLVMVSNAVDGVVGKFNDISIYPSIPGFITNSNALFINITSSPYNALGDGSPAGASQNRVAFQAALQDLMDHPGGGTLFVPAGTYYLDKNPANNPGEEPNKTVRNNSALEIGRPFGDDRPCSNIAIRGDSSAESALVAIDRTTTILFIHRNCCLASQVVYSNIFIDRISFKGRPHIRQGGVYDPGAFDNTNQIFSYPLGLGSLLVFGSDDLAFPIRQVNTFNCKFINPTIDGVILGNVEDFAFRNNQFSFWDGEALPIVSTNQYDSSNGFPIGQVGIFGNGLPSINVVMISNTFNGNPAVTTTNSDDYSSDGIFWFQAGGNWFASDNEVYNYGLEAIQWNAGPAAVVRTRFVTTQKGGATAALVAFASGWPSLTHGSRDQCFYYDNNSINGGRMAFFGLYYAQALTDPLYDVHANGNECRLLPPNPALPFDWPGSLVWVGNCRQAVISGNTLRAGAYGFHAGLNQNHAEIFNNDFGGAEQASIFYEDVLNLERVMVAKNLLSRGQPGFAYPIPSQWASGVHAKVPFANSSRFFLIQNSLLSGTNSASLLLDPMNAPVHVEP